MPAIARATIDTAGTNTNKGVILQGSSTVFLDGKPVARKGDPIAPYGSHSQSKISEGSSDIFVDGIPVARIGDKTDVKDSIITASTDSFADGGATQVAFKNGSTSSVGFLNNQGQPVTFGIGT